MNSSSQSAQAILDAAEALFAKYGFKKTSVDEVSRAAHIGKGSVYLHFSSKEELFAEVLRRVSGRMLDALVAAVKAAPHAGDRLRALLETKLTTANALVAEFRLGEEAGTELLPLARSYREAHAAREHALLEQLLRDGNASGAFAVQHPARLATALMACADALVEWGLHHPDDGERRAGLRELLSVILRGVAAPSRQDEF